MKNLSNQEQDKNISISCLSGILLVDKAEGETSFSLVKTLRKLTGVKKIGHSGTLDPFASGVMAMLIGREYTKKADSFLKSEKQYEALIKLGYTTKTLDSESPEEKVSSYLPTQEEILQAIAFFQGEICQKIPMYSAKKIQGQPLYKLARKGINVDTGEKKVFLKTEFIEYNYPFLKISVTCSGGTYIRQLAEDIGQKLNTGAYLKNLVRQKLGPFDLSNCLKQEKLATVNLKEYIFKN